MQEDTYTYQLRLNISIKEIHFLRGNPKGIHQRGLSLTLVYYLNEIMVDGINANLAPIVQTLSTG